MRLATAALPVRELVGPGLEAFESKRPISHSHTVPSLTHTHPTFPPQDAEAFESKRSRKGAGGQPAWASARVEDKRQRDLAASQQQQQRSELDEDDAFAVRACLGLGLGFRQS